MLYVSDGCRELTGYEPSQLVDDAEVVYGDLIHPDDRQMVRQQVTRVLGREEPFTITYRIRRADGTERWVWDRGRPVRLADEEGVRFHEGFLTDISDRVRTERALAESEARYRALAEGLERRVDERTAELRAANRELEAFSYSVSHDLRAPLRAIDGFSLALVEDMGDELPEDGRNYLARVRAASQRMGELIDDLLSLSRVTRADMSPKNVDLSELAADVGREIRERRPDEPVELHVAPGLSALADEHLLRILFENLLDNAWKFSAGVPEPRVEVGATDGEGGAAFYVRDNGAGFDLAFADRLFSPFQRFHSPGEFEGTGVGLAIVQRIVRRHDGWIWAESAPGAGATFFFTLAVESDTLRPSEGS
jgi:PAS domain S-box-containing protein